MGPPQRPRSAKPPTDELFRAFVETRDPALREQLVLAHTGLAGYLASKFAGRGEPIEDLIQVARVGLLQAVDRYDPGRGVEFSTYATATIVGEIKRYFRDRSWSIHVPRRLRERNNALMQTIERLSARLGRSPSLAEIADAAGMSFEDAVEALEVGRAYNPLSLDASGGGAGEEDDGHPLAAQLGGEDPDLQQFEDRQTLEDAMAGLPERERTILQMRYYEEQSQADVARRLGISQMHVSRLQRSALQRLSAVLGGATSAGPPRRS
jgi:RNA polymerase sigma-B factor